MVFITHCRSRQFRKELRRHGVGVTWQFIRKEAQGWDRSQRCEEQSNEKAYGVKRNTSKAQNRSQAKNQRPNNASSKKEQADAFFQGKCRRCGIHIDRTKKVEVYHAAGGSMHVEDMANIRVCANNIQATLPVAVSSELKETMLISCDDLRKLRVIPADFPNAVLTVK